MDNVSGSQRLSKQGDTAKRGKSPHKEFKKKGSKSKIKGSRSSGSRHSPKRSTTVISTKEKTRPFKYPENYGKRCPLPVPIFRDFSHRMAAISQNSKPRSAPKPKPNHVYLPPIYCILATLPKLPKDASKLDKSDSGMLTADSSVISFKSDVPLCARPVRRKPPAEKAK
ncbi:uncharacterized protein LOC106661488 [Cimex lectularius]|uniref:Uncharacterized protein n=1 Tax=Cimex lectularius TaxID=79782 RepID=A0A8I6RAW5_CIMLE|nr:uncharacterized protein LOC106661488 [Cimex lectularius]